MKNQARTLSITALFTALTIISTVFLKIPLSAGMGYIHAGDIIIFIACFLLPPRYSAIAAGVGSMLADLIVGYVSYMAVTLVVKTIMAFIAGQVMYKNNKLHRLIIGYCLGGIFMISGYFVFEGFIFNWAMALANIPLALLQPAVGIVIAILSVAAIKKIPYIMSFRDGN